MPAKRRDSPDVTPGAMDPVATAIEQWRHERPDLDPSSMAVLGRIARVFALQRRAQSDVHEPMGLTHSSFDMLANLRRSGPPHRKSATELAESSMLSTGGVTFRMDALEEAGLIRRSRSTDDRRVVYAELTPAGRKVIDQAIEHHLAAFTDMLGDLSPREQQDLARLLDKLERSILRHLDEQDDDDAPSRRGRRKSA